MKNINFKKIKKVLGKITLIGLVFGGLLAASSAMASALSAGISVSAISTNIGKTTGGIAHILSNVSLLAGIGFVMASFFKFHQHKLNPTQVPLSQGVTLLLIGACLTLFPILIPTAKRTVFGSTASISKLSGAHMKSLIGASE